MAQTMHSGVTHERCADFRHGKKKQKRGEFITPPRPTGRRSNKTPAQAFTPPADEKKMGTIHWHNLDICVLRRLRLRQGQMQGFLGLKVGGVS